MGCKDRQRQLQDLLSGDLAPKSAAELRAHIEACPSCARDFAAYRQLFAALPSMPEPVMPADLPDSVMVAVRAERLPFRRHRDSVTTVALRRSLAFLFAAAFAVALGAALWGWVARIAGFAGRALSRDLLALQDTARDLWYLIQLLGDVAGLLQPTALALWDIVRQVANPLSGFGFQILLIYAAALLLGSLLCWRAIFPRGERRLSHVS